MTNDLKQGTDEWKQARVGHVTASKISDVMAKTKTGWGASRANYMAQLIAERLTGIPYEGFTNAAMQHGTATEPEARAAYEFFNNVTVEQVGFILHPSIKMTGASPDGLIGDDGLLEIKCPNTATHLETLLGEPIEKKYLLQMQWQMACTGRMWCDFMSYDPRLPTEYQIRVTRIARDDKLIKETENAVILFLSEIDQKIADLKKAVGIDENYGKELMAG